MHRQEFIPAGFFASNLQRVCRWQLVWLFKCYANLWILCELACNSPKKMYNDKCNINVTIEIYTKYMKHK